MSSKYSSKDGYSIFQPHNSYEGLAVIIIDSFGG